VHAGGAHLRSQHGSTSLIVVSQGRLTKATDPSWEPAKGGG
jgi:hypothetical protein